MPDKIIEIPNVGRIAFPDSMTPDQINAAAAKLYAEKNPSHPPPDPKHSWVDTAVDWLPTVGGVAGGVIGGIGGTVGGMGVGGVPGAVGGATLGGAAGEAAKQLINDARGKPVPMMGGAALNIAKQGAIQGGSEAAGAGIASVAAPVMKSAGEAIMQSALKPGIRAAVKSVRAGETPAVVKTLLDEGVNVTPRGIEKLNLIIGATNKEIKDAIAGTVFDVNPYKVASRLGDTAKTFAKQVNPDADLSAVGRVGNEFLENYGGKSIPGQLAQDVKAGTYKQLGGKAYTGELKGAEVESQKSLARGLKEEIEAEFGDTLTGLKGKLGLPGGVDIAAGNAREGKALDALEAVARRVAVGGNNNPAGIAVLAVSHPATFLTALMDRSPAVKSLLARGLYSSAGYAARVNPQLVRAAVEAIATASDTPDQPVAGR